MKLIRPNFYGEVGNNSLFEINGFIVTKINRLEIIVYETPPNDIVALSAICCIVSEKARKVLIEVGLREKDFDEVFFVSKKKGLSITSNYYFIKLDVKRKNIEVYRNTNLLVSDEIMKIIFNLNIGDCKIEDF